MTTKQIPRDSAFWRRMRWVIWGGAVFLLTLPAIAMRFTSEVDWSPSDFVLMGGMLGAVCIAFEVAVRVARSHAYVAASAVAVAAAFLLTWINLAVGIIGSENNPANGMFFGVIAIGLIAVLIARLKPAGMVRAMDATAGAQALTCIITLVIGEGYIFVLTAFFMAMWLIAAMLFRQAAGQLGDAGALSTSQP